MNQEQKDRRNAYHRQYYELNLEKQRKRSRDKYHRLKDNWKANLTPEKKAEKARKNYESQVRFVEKNRSKKVIPRVKKEKVERKVVVIKSEIIEEPKLRTVIKKPKKSKLPIVLEVLRKYKNHYLSFKDKSSWTDTDWIEFNKLNK